jgi:Divergent InlB B-repeat domain
MSRKWFSIVALIAAASLFLSMSSCAFNQHLVSISIAPSGATFGAGDPSLFVNFTASGTYEHPPQTKDITALVTWKSDTPQVAQVTSAGVVSPTLGCGSANVYATFYDSPNLVSSNEAHIVVDGPASLGCTPAGPEPILTIGFAGAGTGTVTGSGISCSTPSACSDQFVYGTTITLTAAPTLNSTFAGWSNCNSTSGTNASVCTVFLQNNLSIIATFN